MVVPPGSDSLKDLLWGPLDRDLLISHLRDPTELGPGAKRVCAQGALLALMERRSRRAFNQSSVTSDSLRDAPALRTWVLLLSLSPSEPPSARMSSSFVSTLCHSSHSGPMPVNDTRGSLLHFLLLPSSH